MVGVGTTHSVHPLDACLVGMRCQPGDACSRHRMRLPLRPATPTPPPHPPVSCDSNSSTRASRWRMAPRNSSSWHRQGRQGRGGGGAAVHTREHEMSCTVKRQRQLSLSGLCGRISRELSCWERPWNDRGGEGGGSHLTLQRRVGSAEGRLQRRALGLAFRGDRDGSRQLVSKPGQLCTGGTTARRGSCSSW